MRAFAVDEFGAAGSIHQIPIPEPGTGEVLVSVHASAVNAMDPLYVAGVMQEYMEHRFPDVAGVVATVGPEVDGVATGDEVYGALAKPFVGAGTFAEQVVVAAEDVAPKPGSLDFAQAAAVPHVGLTALAAIEAADPTPGQVVVVIGATGGVGSFATQRGDRGGRDGCAERRAGAGAGRHWDDRLCV
jgi:NADPH:quinone reductase-like Zn-dependent oxidoreductase